jgi:hypothetical protein
MKRCTRCGRRKRTNEFFFNISVGYPYGQCKPCWRAYMKEKEATPQYKAMRKNARDLRKRSSPRMALQANLCRRLSLRPTKNPVTVDELFRMWNRQSGRCAISGIKMLWGAGNGSGKPDALSMTMDRIDHRKGYTQKNVRLVCYCFNSMRGSMTDKRMFKLMAEAIKYYRRKQ